MLQVGGVELVAAVLRTPPPPLQAARFDAEARELLCIFSSCSSPPVPDDAKAPALPLISLSEGQGWMIEVQGTLNRMLRLSTLRSIFLRAVVFSSQQEAGGAQASTPKVSFRGSGKQAVAPASDQASLEQELKLLMHSDNVLYERDDYLKTACDLWSELADLNSVQRWEWRPTLQALVKKYLIPDRGSRRHALVWRALRTAVYEPLALRERELQEDVELPSTEDVREAMQTLELEANRKNLGIKTAEEAIKVLRHAGNFPTVESDADLEGAPSEAPSEDENEASNDKRRNGVVLFGDVDASSTGPTETPEESFRIVARGTMTASSTASSVATGDESLKDFGMLQHVLLRVLVVHAFPTFLRSGGYTEVCQEVRSAASFRNPLYTILDVELQSIEASQPTTSEGWAGVFIAATRHLPHAIILCDLSIPGVPILAVNTAFELLTGYDASECLGRSCRFLQGAQTSDASVQEMREAIRSHSHSHVSLINYKKDGTPFHNLVSLKPIFDADGLGRFIIGCMVEVHKGYSETKPQLRHVDRLLKLTESYLHTRSSPEARERMLRVQDSVKRERPKSHYIAPPQLPAQDSAAGLRSLASASISNSREGSFRSVALSVNERSRGASFRSVALSVDGNSKDVPHRLVALSVDGSAPSPASNARPSSARMRRRTFKPGLPGHSELKAAIEQVRQEGGAANAPLSSRTAPAALTPNSRPRSALQTPSPPSHIRQAGRAPQTARKLVETASRQEKIPRDDATPAHPIAEVSAYTPVASELVTREPVEPSTPTLQKTIAKGTFATKEDLAAWLCAHGVQTTGWGEGKAKGVSHLFHEIEKEESTLQLLGEKVFRCLSVVKVVVRPPGRMNHYLVCYGQTMDDGRQRDRNQLPSEKQFAHEVAPSACVRCLLEELGSVVVPSMINLLDDSLISWDELIESPSYPGLTTRYVLNQMSAVVTDLPKGQFETTEGPMKRHKWEWREDGPSSLVRKANAHDEADSDDSDDENGDGEDLWSDMQLQESTGDGRHIEEISVSDELREEIAAERKQHDQKRTAGDGNSAVLDAYCETSTSKSTSETAGSEEALTSHRDAQSDEETALQPADPSERHGPGDAAQSDEASLTTSLVFAEPPTDTERGSRRPTCEKGRAGYAEVQAAAKAAVSMLAAEASRDGMACESGESSQMLAGSDCSLSPPTNCGAEAKPPPASNSQSVPAENIVPECDVRAQLTTPTLPPKQHRSTHSALAAHQQRDPASLLICHPFETELQKTFLLGTRLALTPATPIVACARFLADRGINIDEVGQTPADQRRGLYALLLEAGWGESGSETLMQSIGQGSMLARVHRERKLARVRGSQQAWSGASCKSPVKAAKLAATEKMLNQKEHRLRTEALVKAREERKARERAEREQAALQQSERAGAEARARHAAEVEEAARKAAMLEQEQESKRLELLRSRQARRYERAAYQALRAAEQVERENAVRQAEQARMEERLRFPELKQFACEGGVSFGVVPDDGQERSWFDLFCLIAERVEHSLMLVDMNVAGLPITFCNSAAARLTGYAVHEMTGRNCKFLQGTRTQPAAVHLLSKAIREAEQTSVVMTNYKRDGRPFSNLVALQPVHDSGGGYIFSVALQSEVEPGSGEPEWFQQLRDALPKCISTEAEVKAAAASRTADAQSVGSLAQRMLAEAHACETSIMVTRLVFSLDWRAALEHMLRQPLAVVALRKWLLTVEEDETCVQQLDLAQDISAKLGQCASESEVAWHIREELGPKYLDVLCVSKDGRPSGAAQEAMEGAVTKLATVDEALETLRTMASRACADLSSRYLPRFVSSKACSRWLKQGLSTNEAVVESLLWDPQGQYNARTRTWLRSVGKLTLGLSAMVAVADTSVDKQPVVLVNTALCAAFGCEPQQLLGQPLRDSITGTRPGLDAILAKEAKADTMGSGTDNIDRLTCYHPSGKTFSTLCVLRHFLGAQGKAARFALSLQIKVQPGQPVTELVQKLVTLMKLLPLADVDKE